MNKNLLLSVSLLLIAAAVFITFYKAHDIQRTYKARVLEMLGSTPPAENPVLTENDMKHLPEPVQKYLSYVGVIGKEKVYNVRLVYDGQIKTDPDKNWAKIHTEQYNFVGNPARLYLIKGNFSGIPAVGLDSYINGKGNMLIKLGGLFKVADAIGPEMDKGAMVTLLNDMCLNTPASLIDKRLQWETIDKLTVKAAFNDSRCKVSAVLHFNDKGELINFITDDRYRAMNDNTYRNIRWSTPVKDYKDLNGIKLASYGEAIWHMPEGDYCYAKARLQEVEYNCKDFR